MTKIIKWRAEAVELRDYLNGDEYDTVMGMMLSRMKQFEGLDLEMVSNLDFTNLQKIPDELLKYLPFISDMQGAYRKVLETLIVKSTIPYQKINDLPIEVLTEAQQYAMELFQALNKPSEKSSKNGTPPIRSA